jgi:hypothetical protein
MSLIELKNLTIGYADYAVVKNLSIIIDTHDFICIVGPNGSGKTTLIRSILGLTKPLSGRIEYDQISQKSIGYMPQETTVDPNFPASVFEIVLSGTLNRGKNFYDHSTKAIALEALKGLDILSLKDASFSELSGGQRQKVLLARALVATDKLLILDEPSNNLDQKSKLSLYNLIQKIHKERGIAVLMVTHDLDHGNLIGDKILSLTNGDFFFGKTKDFIKKVHHE